MPAPDTRHATQLIGAAQNHGWRISRYLASAATLLYQAQVRHYDTTIDVTWRVSLPSNRLRFHEAVRTTPDGKMERAATEGRTLRWLAEIDPYVPDRCPGGHA